MPFSFTSVGSGSQGPQGEPGQDATLPQDLGTSDSPTFVKIVTSSNGAIDNVKFGDDAYLGDGNVANHLVIKGQQTATLGGIVFGSGKTEKITSNANDLTLTANNDIVLDPGSTYAYLNSITDDNRIATKGQLIVDSGWIQVPSLSNSFVSGGIAPAYRKLNGVVYVRGNAHEGTAGTTMFTLPSGYRPSTTVVLLAQKFGTSAGTYITVNTDGTVVPQDNAAWLSGIVFPV
jgi:hypothetical protein